MAVFGDKTADIDPLADKAEALLNKADELNKNNSEIWCVKKMLASARMMANPMARYQEYGPRSFSCSWNCKKTEPGESKGLHSWRARPFLHLEQFGGDKQEAKKRFETAATKFDTYKPESNIHPNWGLGQTKYFLSQIK